MRPVLMLLLLALSCGAVRAQWTDLKPGQDTQTVAKALGQPLIVSQNKGGVYSTWTYDRGGYVMFEKGRVTFWQPSKKGS